MAKTKAKTMKLEDLKKTRRSSQLSRPMMMLVSSLAAIALFGGGVLAGSLIVGQSQDTEVEQTVRSLSGKTLDQDRADAVASMAAILESTNAPASREEAEPLLDAMEDGDFSPIESNFDDAVVYYDIYESDENFQGEVKMSAFSLATLARASSGGEIAVDESVVGSVKVDQELGIAQVPIETFIDGQSPIAFEMIYSNGRWMLEPHTLVSYLRLSASLQQSSE